MKKTLTISILVSTLFFVAVIPGKTQVGTWTTQESMSLAKGLCTSSVLDGKIYVIGGITSPTSLATSEVEVYNPVTNTWENNAADLPVGLCAASSSAVNGKIYVTGGHPSNTPEGALASVYAYDPLTDTWTSKADMIKSRFYHATAVIDNKIYVMGGRHLDYPDPLENTVEMYDTESDTWTSLASMITSRAIFSAEVVDGKIYVMGGSAPGVTFSSVEVYDPATDTWAETDEMPGVRWGHGSWALNNQVYLFGGANMVGPEAETWNYDLQTNEWTDVAVDIPDLVGTFAYSIAEDASGEQCFYALGGTYPSFWLGGSEPFLSDGVLKFSLSPTSTKNLKEASAPIVLFQNEPNPFDAFTMIRYELKNSGKVSIKIFNLAGQEVATLYEGTQQAGEHEIEWKAPELSGGIYFYQLQTEGYVETKKCILRN